MRGGAGHGVTRLHPHRESVNYAAFEFVASQPSAADGPAMEPLVSRYTHAHTQAKPGICSLHTLHTYPSVSRRVGVLGVYRRC